MSGEPDDREEKWEIPERFLEPPKVYIGDEPVWDPYDPDRNEDLIDALLEQSDDEKARTRPHEPRGSLC